jgi:hypothetical protein
MVNYQLGKIYKIVDNTNGNIYIGSTCKPYLSRRLSGHKTDYKRYVSGVNPNINTSFEILKNENYDIVLLENFPCDDKNQLHARERHYIETLNCVNKVHPLRTNKEYKEDNKEHLSEYNKQYHKQYNIENKEHLKDYKSDWYELHKEELKTKAKVYRSEKIELIKTQKKLYYEANKVAISAKRKEKYKLKKEQQQNILEV